MVTFMNINSYRTINLIAAVVGVALFIAWVAILIMADLSAWGRWALGLLGLWGISGYAVAWHVYLCYREDWPTPNKDESPYNHSH